MRTQPRTRSLRRTIDAIPVALRAGAAAALATTILVLGTTGPVHAQYGDDGIDFFTDPRVPIGDTFSVFGSGCAAGSIVEISIDGIPGVIATTTASGAGNYSISDIDLPLGLVAGTEHDVRATCGPETATALMTLLCHDGELPIDGECFDGSDGIVGGVGPTTTTTVAPNPAPGDDDGQTTGGTPGDSSNGGSGGSSGDTGSNPGLAITGASLTELLLQVAVTLFAVGALLTMTARRRRAAAI